MGKGGAITKFLKEVGEKFTGKAAKEVAEETGGHIAKEAAEEAAEGLGKKVLGKAKKLGSYLWDCAKPGTTHTVMKYPTRLAAGGLTLGTIANTKRNLDEGKPLPAAVVSGTLKTGADCVDNVVSIVTDPVGTAGNVVGDAVKTTLDVTGDVAGAVVDKVNPFAQFFSDNPWVLPVGAALLGGVMLSGSGGIGKFVGVAAAAAIGTVLMSGQGGDLVNKVGEMFGVRSAETDASADVSNSVADGAIESASSSSSRNELPSGSEQEVDSALAYDYAGLDAAPA